jgi:hypothetical protein
MNRFFIKICIFSLPALAVVASFFILDPFKILYNHGDKIFTENGTLDGFTLNRDIVGTEMFLQKKDVYHYDSFIFGSSKTTGILSADWDTLIDNQAPPFHFIGSGETIFGVWSKITYLDKIKYPIKNALFLFDAEMLNTTKDGDGIISIRHKTITGNDLHYYLTHFKEYITTDFFIQYLDYKIFKKQRRYMDKLFDNDNLGLLFDNYKNDWIFVGRNKELAQNEEAYYEKRKEIFYERTGRKTISTAVIGDKQVQMLNDIKNILDKSKATYHIIINPDYNQKSMDTIDLRRLKLIFQTEKVHDFSGINAFTKDKKNYYDNYHFKPQIGKAMLNDIYKIKSAF